MNASIEWLDDAATVGLIRTHQDGGAFGDPYTWSVVFAAHSYGAVLKGIYRKPTLEEGRAVRGALRRAGLTAYRYMRANKAPRSREVQL